MSRLAMRWKKKFEQLVVKQTTENKRAERKIFRSDQMKLLSGEVLNVKKWSDETVTDSLQIRFMCRGGYDKLIKRGFPFPSTRTFERC